MEIGVPGHPVLPYVAGAVLGVAALLVTWRRTLRKPAKRFDVVEYGIVPAVLLVIAVLADLFIDISDDYVTGLSLALLVLFLGAAMSLGWIGFLLWVMLAYSFFTHGTAALDILALSYMALLAGSLIGYGLGRAQLARTRRSKSAAA